MVGNFCNRTACRIRNRRRRHDSNMTLRKKRTPRASLHYVGWKAWQTSMLLPVAGEVFLLTLPLIERRYRTNGGLVLVCVFICFGCLLFHSSRHSLSCFAHCG